MSLPNHRAAGAQVARIYWRKATGLAHATKVRRQANARRIGEAIWKYWHVGYYEWQQKHIRWVLYEHLAGATTNSRYQYRLTLEALLSKERASWLDKSQGWVSETKPADGSRAAVTEYQ